MASPSDPSVPSPPTPEEQASAAIANGLKLLEQGKREDLPEAAGRFREAVEIRRAAPPTGDIWQRYNLAGSYMSLGDVLTRQGSPETLAEGGRAYDAAMAIL